MAGDEAGAGHRDRSLLGVGLAKTVSLIATAPYVGKYTTAATGEVLDVPVVVAVVLLRTGKFKYHKRVSTPVQEPPRRRTYRRRDMVAE